ncbi:MAG: 3-dehydroquinate synthase [Oscillospiraceae bacterium]
MRAVKVNTQKPYEVLIANNYIDKVGRLIKSVIKPCRACIVTDDIVDSLYAQTVERSLADEGFEVCRYVILHGEESKNLGTVSKILEYMAQNKLSRSDIVVALGGGVVGDTGGFAAACYMRGIRFVQIPTTLLAAVDSSVGGKTGVNLPEGKNLAGAFHQPEMVLCDTGTLDSLQDSIYSCGIAEAVKCGILCDSELFEMLCHDGFDIEDVIERCVKIKAEIVKNDEYDSGERQLLNLGHTVGHAIEKCSEYAIPHGHAVAIGTVIITRAAQKLKITEENCLDEIIAAFEKNGLPISCAFSAHELASAALNDKKRDGGEITIVVPKKIGHAVLYKLKTEMLEGFIKIGME